MICIRLVTRIIGIAISTRVSPPIWMLSLSHFLATSQCSTWSFIPCSSFGCFIDLYDQFSDLDKEQTVPLSPLQLILVKLFIGTTIQGKESLQKTRCTMHKCCELPILSVALLLGYVTKNGVEAKQNCS